ncbi:hypothetical protein E3U55_15545 [Filobacillus milosensis]|uniref:Tyr recombinase domain-containing protein n=1 Tax=Filobacillus milosensis TaxID=94137 RepID=A0A4Y8IF72_9BACI|nr:tyrosine-type recombinase/integrase [Filobacillus milosensis]TFB13670.1 hypothetical protein E3U55_15545 [Filobacillus milosensis]
MKSFKEEIYIFYLGSRYSENYKRTLKKRLEQFLEYLARVTETPNEEVHLNQIYETVSPSGKFLFYSRLDVKLLEQYFLENLYKSYNWLQGSRTALQNFFLYLYRKYDFPILTDQMTFDIDDYKQKPIKKDNYIPTRHDILKFVQSLINHSTNLSRDALYFLLLISTGSRPSEIINTKVKDIDFQNEFIYLERTKNKSSHFIPLRTGYNQMIQRYIYKSKLKGEDYLINHNGKHMSRKELQDLLTYFLDKANLPHFTLHSFRRSFATIMADSGVAIVIIQQILNHKKIHSTSHYIDPNIIRNERVEIKVNKDVYKNIRLYKK